MLRTVSRLYGELADEFGELSDDEFGELSDDDKPTGESAVESANSGLKSADSTADSTAYSAKVGVWVRAFSVCDSYEMLTISSTGDDIP